MRSNDPLVRQVTSRDCESNSPNRLAQVEAPNRVSLSLYGQCRTHDSAVKLDISVRRVLGYTTTTATLTNAAAPRVTRGHEQVTPNKYWGVNMCKENNEPDASEFHCASRARFESLVLFGDSIANGIGVSGRSYGQLVAQQLQLRLYDYSGSAKMVTESLEECGVLTVPHLSLCIIAHGATEGIVRPSPSCLRWVPRRWRAAGWMDPRPYYSSRWQKRIVQRIESSLRWRVKVFLLRYCGSRTYLEVSAYADTLRELIVKLSHPSRQVLVLSHVDVSQRFFPGSPKSLFEYADAAAHVARETGAIYVSLEGVCVKWNDFFLDHFHPNSTGHEKIAETIVASLHGQLAHLPHVKESGADN